MKFCIYSGTFNPVHKAHIELVRGILDEYDYDKIIIIPNNIPPHKNGEDIASAQERLEMLHLAFDDSRIEISDIEISRGGLSYSYDTVCAIKQKYGVEGKIDFLLGTDALMGLRGWYRFEDFVKEVDFIVAQRQDDFNPIIILSTLNISGLTCTLSKVPFLDISSSELRQKVRQNEDVFDMTHSDVILYIQKNRLYKTYNYFEIIEILEKEFNSHIEHSEAVANMAVELAPKYGVDVNKARIAGILHDCVKYIGKDAIKNMVIEKNVEVFDHELSAPRTLHAPLGAYVAQERFGISDEDIINAIRFHTIGRCEMSLLEKIIFISDKIEPVTREEEFRHKIEPYLEIGLDAAIGKYFELLLQKLSSEGVEITGYTKEVYECFQK